jgi:hypothetical protein
MGTGRCTDVLVLLPPSSANKAESKVRVISERATEKAAIAITCNERHAIRVSIGCVLNGGHWCLRCALDSRGRPAQESKSNILEETGCQQW